MRLRCQHRSTMDYEQICRIRDDQGVGRQDGGRLMMDYEIGRLIHGQRIIDEAGAVNDTVVNCQECQAQNAADSPD
jgi:hypothetical protein